MKTKDLHQVNLLERMMVSPDQIDIHPRCLAVLPHNIEDLIDQFKLQGKSLGPDQCNYNYNYKKNGE